MDDVGVVSIENDVIDQKDRIQAQADIKKKLTRFKMATKMEEDNENWETRNGMNYMVRVSNKGGRFVKYHLNVEIMKEFNSKFLRKKMTRR